MSEPNQHPPRQEMQAYVQGTLAPEQAEPLAQHLGECPECSETVANLEQQSADTFVADLRQRPATEPFADEPQLRQAMAELREAPRAEVTQKQPKVALTELLDTRLGEYELLSLLGEGGMGAVYKARHGRLGKLVALKVLAAARMSDPAVVARFEREMKAVGQLRHANIVAAHDAGEHAGRHYLVMELVEGEDLAKLVKREGPLPLDRACRLAAQAARGLAYAHAKGVVHRDIKPSNLLVDSEGTLKILDLGLARVVDGAAEAGEGLTAESQIMGTPEYMAPEQGTNTSAADARSDLYSLGCTLYYLLAGRVPYPADSQLDRLFAHRERPVPSVRAARPEAPAELDDLLARLLAKRPEDRPADAGEVATALDKIALSLTADPAPTAVLPATRSAEGAAPPFWKQPWTLGGFAAAALAAALAIILILRNADGTITIEVSPEAQKDVQISIQQGGKEVQIADAKRGWTIRLADGKYDLDFKAGGDRFQLTDQTVEVRRGDATVVTVTLKPAALAALPKPPADPPTPPNHLPPPADPFAPKSVSLGEFALIREPAPLPGLKSWSVATARPLERNSHAAFRPDGRQVALFGSDSLIRIFDTQTGTLQSVLHSETNTRSAHSLGVLAWHPEGKRLASLALSETSGLRLWDTETGTLIRDLKAPVGLNAYSLAWSPDGKLLAAELGINQDKRRLLLLDADGLIVRQVELVSKEGSRGIAWSPEGDKVAIALRGQLGIRVFARDSLEMILALETKESFQTMSPIWSPDGASIAAIQCESDRVFSVGRQIRVWDAASGKLTRTIPIETVHEGLVWSPDSTQIAAVSRVEGNSTHLHFWDARSGELVRKAAKVDTSSNPQGVVWSADKRLFAIVATEDSKLYEAASGAVRYQWPNEEFGTGAPSWSRNGQWLSLRRRYSLGAWNLLTPGKVRATPVYGRAVCDWSSAGVSVSVDQDCNCLFHSGATGEEVARVPLKPHALPASSAFDLAWSPHGKFVAIALKDAGVLFLDFEARKVGRVLKTKAEYVAWSPDNRLLATASTEEKYGIRIWDIESGEEVRHLDEFQGRIYELAWSPDGNWLAVGAGLLGKSSVLNTKTWKVLHELTPGGTGFRWSPDSTRLQRTVGWGGRAEGGKLIDWSLAEKRELTTVPAPIPQHSSRLSPDGRLVATESSVGATAWIWESAAGKVRGALVYLGGEEGIAVSPEGHVRFSSSKAEEQVVYVGLTTDGRQITYTPAEFAAKYGWKNDPAKVRLVPDESAAGSTGEPDRRAAEWALSIDGKLHIKESGQERPIAARGDLPRGAFELTAVNLNFNPKVSDAGLSNFKGCKNLTKLQLDNTGVSDAGLAHFQDCKNLTVVDLSQNAKVSDAGLVHFKDCKNLAGLVLNHTQVSDAGLAHFQDCKHLTRLDLYGTQVSDAGLAYFQDCRNLTSLYLPTQASDAGLAHFKDCKNLASLALEYSNVSDAGLGHLKDWKNLTDLYLRNTRVTDAGLAHFQDCKTLTRVFLNHTRVSDACLADLASLPSLVHLELVETRISLSGYEQLKAAMPQCQITWSETNRSVAEGVLALDGTVEIGMPGQAESRPVKAAADLPAGYFQVRRVSLARVSKPLDKLPELLSWLRFTEFDRLESLDLSGIGGLNYDFLVPIHGLQELSLANVKRKGAWLAQLPQLPALKRLVLDGNDLSGTGVASLENRTALTELSLVNAGLNDDSLALLPKLPDLKRLVLDGNEIRGTGVTHLNGQPKLIDLSLGCPILTDLTAKNLADLKQLKRLSLAGSGVSDAGIKHLVGLINLESLDVRRTKVTTAVIAELQIALPKCQIKGEK